MRKGETLEAPEGSRPRVWFGVRWDPGIEIGVFERPFVEHVAVARLGIIIEMATVGEHVELIADPSK